jgi:hypothetical protein
MISYAFLLSCVVGCGGKGAQDCNFIAISVIPQNGAANHAAIPPGNQQKFLAGGVVPAGCPPPPAIVGATWSVSDPVNVTISSAMDSTNGTATCKGVTAGAVTVTATSTAGNGKQISGTGILTCN